MGTPWVAASPRPSHPPSVVHALVIGGMGSALVEGIGGEEKIVAALEAPTLEEAVGDAGRGYRKFAEQTRSDRAALAACIIGQRIAISAAELATIRAPTLVAVGEKDAVAGSAEGLARLIPDAEVLIIPRRDHMLATGDKVFKQGVLDFLERRGLGAATDKAQKLLWYTRRWPQNAEEQAQRIVRLAAEGKTVLVTDRSRVVAEIIRTRRP